MFLSYGNYHHASSEAQVTISRLAKYSEGGILIGFKESWHLSGFLQAPSAPALTQALFLLNTAYSIQGNNIGLFFDNGAPTNHFLASASCVGGTRVVEGPDFPEGGGAEYNQGNTTFRSYTIKVEGDVISGGTGLLAFHESLSFTGTGGPQTLHLQTLNGLPQKQRVSDATVSKVTQSGEAIGQFTYPPVPGPLWPAAELLPQRQLVPKSPKRTGPPGRPTFVEWPVSWTYQFESNVPLAGQPNRWY